MPDQKQLLHATCVALAERAVLILGKSGSGKSALGLHLMALGAALISDDQVLIRAEAGQVMATAPDTLRGRIEARGIGILKLAAQPEARVIAVVDMELPQTTRLPEGTERQIAGVPVPLIHGKDAPVLAYAVMALLRGAIVE